MVREYVVMPGFSTIEPKRAYGPHRISSHAPTGKAGRFGLADTRPALANQLPAIWPTSTGQLPLPSSPMKRLLVEDASSPALAPDLQQDLVL